MLLSDFEIQAEIDAGRIVFDPPLPSTRIQTASVDLDLHDVFWRSKLPSGPGVDVRIDVHAAAAYQYFESETATEILLDPGDFVLGETAQAIGLPRHLAGHIEGKSGLARHGLIVHCTAPHIAPGWGPKRVTLEIANLGKAPLRLRAGAPIAQLLILKLSAPSAGSYSGKHRAFGS